MTAGLGLWGFHPAVTGVTCTARIQSWWERDSALVTRHTCFACQGSWVESTLIEAALHETNRAGFSANCWAKSRNMTSTDELERRRVWSALSKSSNPKQANIHRLGNPSWSDIIDFYWFCGKRCVEPGMVFENWRSLSISRGVKSVKWSAPSCKPDHWDTWNEKGT